MSETSFAIGTFVLLILLDILYWYFAVYRVIEYTMGFALGGEDGVVILLLIPVFFLIVGGIYITMFFFMIMIGLVD
jgi:hypothetical protein